MSAALLVLDASILTKLFFQEDGSDRADALVQSTSIVAAPAIARTEVAGAITRRYRVGGVDRGAAEIALGKAEAFFDSSTVSLTPDATLLSRAQVVALDLRHPLPDCLYLALAEREKADLVTADQTFVARAGKAFTFVRSLADV